MLGAQPLVLERAPDDDQQLVDLERLLQVVERAELHRLDARSRPWRAPSSSGSAAARPRASTPTYSRIRSRPVSSGITLSTTQHVERALGEQPLRLARAASSRRPRGRRRAARGRAPSGSSLRRRRAESSRDVSCGGVRARPRGAVDAEARCGSSVPRPGVLETAIVPPRPSTMFFAIGRPRPVPPRLVVKYGSKTCGRSAGAMPTPRSATTMRDAAVAAARRLQRDRGGAGDAPPSPFTAWRALTSRLTSAIRSRSASVVDRAERGSRSSVDAGARAGRLRGGRRLAAERVEVGRRELEPDRPREVEHLVDDPVQPRRPRSSMSATASRSAVGARRPAAAACAATP